MKGAVNVTRFKGLGEMNPSQLRESTIHPDTRRLVQLTVDGDDTRVSSWTCCSPKSVHPTARNGWKRRAIWPSWKSDKPAVNAAADLCERLHLAT